AEFSAALQAKIDTICRAREQLKPNQARQFAVLTDCRFPNEESTRFLEEGRRGFVDAAITSPPYATALPYVDTQRLSLCLLGLIGSDQIMTTERTLIGGREITSGQRARAEGMVNGASTNLPGSITRLTNDMIRAVSEEDG